jgi:hypothetical protein
MSSSALSFLPFGQRDCQQMRHQSINKWQQKRTGSYPFFSLPVNSGKTALSALLRCAFVPRSIKTSVCRPAALLNHRTITPSTDNTPGNTEKHECIKQPGHVLCGAVPGKQSMHCPERPVWPWTGQKILSSKGPAQDDKKNRRLRIIYNILPLKKREEVQHLCGHLLFSCWSTVENRIIETYVRAVKRKK